MSEAHTDELFTILPNERRVAKKEFPPFKFYEEFTPISLREIITNEEIKQLKLARLSTNIYNSIVERIVYELVTCEPQIINDMGSHSYQLKNKNIDIYDANAMKGMSCALTSLIARDDKFYPDDKLRLLSPHVKLINKKSLFGDAYILKGDSAMFIVKMNKKSKPDKLNNISVAHEALIGLLVLNNLRAYVPSFMYTYGIYRCDYPNFDKNDKNDNLISWCPGVSSESTNYVVLENIDNSLQLRDLKQTLTPNEFLQIYLQVINAINIAYHMYDFTHYDLHAQNVLIQVLKFPVAVPLYLTNNDIVYIRTYHLARIIDYGKSHVFIEGVHFGIRGHTDAKPLQSFPLYDAYRFLISCDTHKLREIITQIYHFFYMDSYVEKFKKSTAYKNAFKLPVRFEKETIDILIEYILTNIKTPFIHTTIPPDCTLTICDDKCMDWSTLNAHIFNQTLLPRNLFEYVYALKWIEKTPPKRQKEIYEWLNIIDLQEYYEREQKQFKIVVDELCEILEENILTKFTRKTDVPIILEALNQLVVIHNKVISVHIWYEALMWVNEDFELDEAYKRLMNAYNNSLLDLNYFAQMSDDINEALRVLQPIN